MSTKFRLFSWDMVHEESKYKYTYDFLYTYGFLLYKHWTKEGGPYWTSRENSLVMTDRVIGIV